MNLVITALTAVDVNRKISTKKGKITEESSRLHNYDGVRMPVSTLLRCCIFHHMRKVFRVGESIIRSLIMEK